MAAPPPASTTMYFSPPPMAEIPPAPMTASPAGPTIRQMSNLPVGSSSFAVGDIRAAKTGLEFGLREYMKLQEQRYRTGDVAIDDQLRAQAANLVSNIRLLRNEVSAIVSSAESHRWRRLISGVAVASFIPAVRAIFRRPPEEKDAANDTEYAFRKSKTLIARIKSSLPGRGALAAVAFFVFAVLYVFQNEVSLRVGRTLSRRLKRLSARIESGQGDILEDDMRLLRGWRWRVLLWRQ